MIQSKDNSEAKTYSHLCGDIFVKLSNFEDKNSQTSVLRTSESGYPTSITKDRAGKKVNCNSNIELSEVSDDILLSNKKLINKKSNDKNLNDKKNENKVYREQSNHQIDYKKSDLNDKLSDKSNKKSIDLIGKTKLRSIYSKLKNRKKKLDKIRSVKEYLRKELKKHSLKKNSVKKNIKINHRKRSNIENIFDLNTVGRMKADMSYRPLVFCGPSGSGKSTLLKKLRNDFPTYFGFSISHTTRVPRCGEKHGQDYYYVTKEEMLKAIENDEFIETAEFSGNIYGTSKKAVEDVQSKGKICILDIEIEGVKNIKKSNLNPFYIFVKPPNIDELEKRLRRRGSETEENIQKRLRRAEDEIAFGDIEGNFDLLLVNDDFDSTYDKLKSFVSQSYDLPDTSDNKTEINSS